MTQLTRRNILAGATAASAAALVPPRGAIAQTAAPKQAPGFYRSKLGDYDLVVLSDGGTATKIETSPSRTAKVEDVKEVLSRMFVSTDEWRVPYNATFVDTGSKRILIDTGNGPARGPTVGMLQSNLAAAGIDPKSIDIVLISHFHGDHITGLRLADGSLAFPNAEIKVGAVEWAYWMDDGEMSRAPQARQAGFQNVRRVFSSIADKVTKYEWEREVAPGITAMDTAGHTPGHTSFVIQSGRDKLIVQGDVASGFGPVYVRHPDWVAGGDMDGPTAVRSRRRLFDMLVSERILSIGFHFPFPATAHTARESDGYRLVPIIWNPVL